jgi:acetyltransferase-like isoleucine patch superfamily enzyme
MIEKIKRYIAKGLRYVLQPPALTNCKIDKTSAVCSGSQINRTSMGRYSYIGHDCFFVNVDVGSFCSIADGCRVGGAMHPIQRVSSSPVFHAGKNVMKKNFCHLKEIETPKTIIGNDVWIGANVCIKAGIRIGDGAVIGMGAIVTEDVAPYEVRAGVPARLIKKRFDEDTIKKLLETQWWDWADEKIVRLADNFENVEEFLKHI